MSAGTIEPKPPKQEKSKTSVVRVPVLPVRDTVHFSGVIQSLLVGREMSVRAVMLASSKRRELLVVSQRDHAVDDPRPSDLFNMGTLTEVLHILPLPDGTLRVVLRGLERVRCRDWANRAGALQASFDPKPVPVVLGDDVEALRRECMAYFSEAATLGMQVPPEVAESIHTVEDAIQLTDTIAHHLTVSSLWKQDVLEEDSVVRRLEILNDRLASELKVLELQQSLRNRVEKELGATQREFFLREQLRVIQAELGDHDQPAEEGDQYRARILASGMPSSTAEHALQELRRLERSPETSPECMVIRTYLDWLCALPWQKSSEDRINVHQATRILNRDHHGLNKVKDRILDYLAVRQLAGNIRGPILCLVGPPGVGKTSIGRSIAESMGRAFHRVSLGGIRDEAEIRGHRRTYIGSMPGRLIQGLKACGTNNPVFLLDEIDKMGSDHRGDPMSALLEALDPEQNSAFTDHYIESPVDLSRVMFLATANLIEEVPPALRDRMEVIRFPGYSEEEKLSIAQKHLVPKKIDEHGLRRDQLTVSKKALMTVIRDYTREAGVRSLSRELSTLCRKSARRIAEDGDQQIQIDSDELCQWLGRSRFRSNSRWDRNEVGAATGLVYSEYGGDILTIEVCLTLSVGDQPNVRLTGSLGDVMKESALAALTYLRANHDRFGGSGDIRRDLHIHVPEGAVPKDGPSAGVTILTALVSAYTNREVRRDVAMTGEITLRGKVLPVGGIREKILAAHRAGIKHVILPDENQRDLEDIPKSTRDSMVFSFVKTADEVLAHALV